MKHQNTYGTFKITRQTAQQLQLEWAMVEPAAPARFLNFPCVESTVKPETRFRAARPMEKRRLAA